MESNQIACIFPYIVFVFNRIVYILDIFLKIHSHIVHRTIIERPPSCVIVLYIHLYSLFCHSLSCVSSLISGAAAVVTVVAAHYNRAPFRKRVPLYVCVWYVSMFVYVLFVYVRSICVSCCCCCCYCRQYSKPTVRSPSSSISYTATTENEMCTNNDNYDRYGMRAANVCARTLKRSHRLYVCLCVCRPLS